MKVKREDGGGEKSRYTLGTRLARWAEFCDAMAQTVGRSLLWAVPLLVGMRVFGGAPEWMVWPVALGLALVPLGCLWLRGRLAARAEAVFDEEIGRIQREIRELQGE